MIEFALATCISNSLCYCRLVGGCVLSSRESNALLLTCLKNSNLGRGRI
jgi:hypothetical protein